MSFEGSTYPVSTVNGILATVVGASVRVRAAAVLGLLAFSADEVELLVQDDDASFIISEVGGELFDSSRVDRLSTTTTSGSRCKTERCASNAGCSHARGEQRKDERFGKHDGVLV